MALAEQAVGGLPQMLEGVDDVEHQWGVRQRVPERPLECVGTVGQRHALLDVWPVVLAGPCSQAGQRRRLTVERRPQLLPDRPGPVRLGGRG